MMESSWAKVTVVLAALAAAGCYNPKVGSGDLHCAVATGKQCPDGFECVGNVCVTVGTSPLGSGGGIGSGGGVGSGGMTGTGGGAGGSGGMAIPSRQLGQTCNPVLSQVQPGQANCAVKLLCVEDCLMSSARCYQTCLSDADCPQSVCRPAAAADAPRVCEIAYGMCNPLDGHMGCANVAENCYLLSSTATSSGGDRAVCDCSLGSSVVSTACSDSRECAAGLVCPPQGGGPGTGACRRICDPAPTAPATCTAGATCRAYGARWGYCF
jgi:hypothetical protein